MPLTRRLTKALLATVALVVAACAPPARGSAGDAPPVYALRGAGGPTGGGLTRINASGRVSHMQPVEPGPLLMAPGPDGRLVLLSLLDDVDAGLTLMEAAPVPAGRVVRRLALPAASGVRLVAAGRYAALVYAPNQTPSMAGRGDGRDADGGARCVVAVIDLGAFAVARTIPLCSRGELVTGLAMDGGPRPLLYVGLERYAASVEPNDAPAAARVLAVDVESGAVVAALPMVGTPAALVLAPAPDIRAGEALHLYVAETSAGADDHHSAAGGWRLTGLAVPNLTPEHVQPLTRAVRRLAPAADGRALYAVSDTGRALLRIDLAARADRLVAPLPGEALDLLVTPDRVFLAGVPDRPASAGLWSVDTRTSRISTIAGMGSAVALAVPN